MTNVSFTKKTNDEFLSKPELYKIIKPNNKKKV